jgi:hypothetical protein
MNLASGQDSILLNHSADLCDNHRNLSTFPTYGRPPPHPPPPAYGTRYSLCNTSPLPLCLLSYYTQGRHRPRGWLLLPLFCPLTTQGRHRAERDWHRHHGQFYVMTSKRKHKRHLSLIPFPCNYSFSLSSYPNQLAKWTHSEWSQNGEILLQPEWTGEGMPITQAWVTKFTFNV